jgi:hypothetical protein
MRPISRHHVCCPPCKPRSMQCSIILSPTTYPWHMVQHLMELQYILSDDTREVQTPFGVVPDPDYNMYNPADCGEMRLNH